MAKGYSQRHFFQTLIHLQNADFVCELGPAALGFCVFERSPARFVRLPMANEHVLALCTSIKHVAAIPPVPEYAREFAYRFEGLFLVALLGYKHRDR
jgi:hypothetical protein